MTTFKKFIEVHKEYRALKAKVFKGESFVEYDPNDPDQSRLNDLAIELGDLKRELKIIK